MSDFATSLRALLDRAVDASVDAIAKEGLVALKASLDGAGFGRNDKLKDYDVYAHVSGNEITFELQVEFDALDDETKETVLRQEPVQERVRAVARSYAVSGVGGSVTQISGRRDARSPARDARKKIHDARRPPSRVGSATKGAAERLAEHELNLRMPRGMSITRTGKLSVALERITQVAEDGSVRLPQGDFQGILGDFMERLEKVVAQRFVPALEEILRRNL